MPSADDVVWELALVLVVYITVHTWLAQYITDNQAIYAMGKMLLNSKYYKMLKKINTNTCLLDWRRGSWIYSRVWIWESWCWHTASIKTILWNMTSHTLVRAATEFQRKRKVNQNTGSYTINYMTSHPKKSISTPKTSFTQDWW